MYVLQESPDAEAVLENGQVFQPVATLKDEYGGISHIINDDHCYVLLNKNCDLSQQAGQPRFSMVCHWHPEAVAALRTLPLPN